MAVEAFDPALDMDGMAVIDWLRRFSTSYSEAHVASGAKQD